MKKVSLLAGVVASLTLAVTPVFAQGGPFADVPADHWAYGAVDRLQKRGIVIGYPDGTYGGKRSMTRYEFAIAINRLLDLMGNNQSGSTTSTQDMSQYATKDDLTNALQNYATKQDIADLKRLVGEFQAELQTLGVNIDAANKRLDALEGRVKALEDKVDKILQVHGEFNVYSRSNNRFETDVFGGRDALSVRDANGFEVTGGQGSRGGLLADTRVFHDLDLNILANVDSKTTFEGVINFGNYLSFLQSTSSFTGVRSDRGPSTPTSPTGYLGFPGQRVNQDQIQTIYKAQLTSAVTVPGLGQVGVSVGRMPMQITPYTLRLIDVDYYFDNTKTDSGGIPMDGIQGKAKIGPVGVMAFAAKIDPIRFVSNSSQVFDDDTARYGLYAGASRGGYRNPNTIFRGANGRLNAGLQAGFLGAVAPDGYGFLTGNRPVGSPIAPDRNGAMFVEQMAGARLELARANGFRLAGTYIYMGGAQNNSPVNNAQADSPADDAAFNRVAVYGADVEGNIGPVGLYGFYTKSDTGGERARNGVIDGDTETKIDEDNDAWDVGGKFQSGAFKINAGYRKIAPYFAAPGFWGRVGSLFNPTDIQGVYGTLDYRFSNFVSAVGAVHSYEGTGDAVLRGGLSEDDKIQNYRVGLRFGFLPKPSTETIKVDSAQAMTSAQANGGQAGAAGTQTPDAQMTDDQRKQMMMRQQMMAATPTSAADRANVDLGVERTEYDVLNRAGNGRVKPRETWYNIGFGYLFNPTSSFKVLYQIINYDDKDSQFDTINGNGGVLTTAFTVRF